MFTGKVIGSVVATRKHEKLTGVRFLVIQPLNSRLEPIGQPVIAVDTVGAGAGEFVFLAKSREASLPPNVRGTPVDAAVVGIIDSLDRADLDSRSPAWDRAATAYGFRPGDRGKV